MIPSMLHMVLYIAIVTALLLIVTTNKQPLHSTWSMIKEMMTTKLILLHFAGMLAILYINKLELRFENAHPINLDMTPLLHRIEGNWIASLQGMFTLEPLTYVLVFFYVVVFPALLVTSLILYVYSKNHRLFYTLCYAIMMNYLMAIPFYLFFPVNEVWAYAPSGVNFLMLDAYPTFESEYRGLSGLNNCFPSLHTSISVTLALIARESGIRAWRWITGVSASIIIFSIFYLGIHWLIDMAGGLLLAWFAVTMALRLSVWSDRQLPSRYRVQLEPQRQTTSI